MVKCEGNKWKETLKSQLSSLDTNKLAEKIDLHVPSSLVVAVGPEKEIVSTQTSSFTLY